MGGAGQVLDRRQGVAGGGAGHEAGGQIDLRRDGGIGIAGGVAAGAAVQAVAAGAALQAVIAIVADQGIVEGGADEILDLGIAVAIGIALAAAGSQVCDHRRASRHVGRRVGMVGPVLGRSVTDQHVGAGAADQGVVAAGAGDMAGIDPGIEGVVAGAADQQVIAAVAVQAVVTVAAPQFVAAPAAVDRVGEGAADDSFESVEVVAGRLPAETEGEQVQADIDAARGIFIGDEVATRAAIHGVGAGAAAQGVVAVAAGQAVVAAVAVEEIVPVQPGQGIVAVQTVEGVIQGRAVELVVSGRPVRQDTSPVGSLFGTFVSLYGAELPDQPRD